ncbi:MAG: ABC transporter permease subunit [Clostridiaceae bacterium]|nr:ABC transporter permease subunit [Clostridiaceae bacterium]
MKAILRRELNSYFLTATGYIYMFVFLSLSSLIFFLNNLNSLSSDMSSFFSMMSYVWMLLTPVLVMKLIAGERKSMTDQLLLTSPVTMADIILGKYFAAAAVLLLSILMSFLYPILISFQSRIHLSELSTVYLGFMLQGCAFIAFDLMISSLCKNPMTAAISTFGANMFLWLASIASSGSSVFLIKEFNRYFNLYERLVPFLSGQLSIANIVYYFIFCIVCLYASIQIISSRRWSEVS